MKDSRLKVVKEAIQEHGYVKAVRVLCKEKICISRAEARRLVNWVKIQNGDKKARYD